MNEFDPNDVGISNGNIFGFPVEEDQANIVIIPVPWDATASYKKGTAKGPQAILDSSTQLDFYHPRLDQAFNTKVFMAPISEQWVEINEELSASSIQYLDKLEHIGKEAMKEFDGLIEQINRASASLTENLKERCLNLISKGKIPAVLGGEHSVPLGLIQALNESYESFGVLQIDAHADLRVAYEAFEQSHASIMHNVLASCTNMTKLVQVGIRDISDAEVKRINLDSRIQTFYDWNLKESAYKGNSWEEICQTIASSLPQNIYISFDIDGLNPELCPNTGTPVPGGLDFSQIAFLLSTLNHRGKRIIGFDLNEVAPGPDGDWDANVGARVLWELICSTEISRLAHV